MRMRILANNYPIFFLHLIFSLSLTNTNSETLAILVPAAQHRHRSRLGSGLFFILNNSFNIRHTLQLQLHSHSLYYDLKYVSIVYVTSHERIYVTVIRYSITHNRNFNIRHTFIILILII
jgi:hypothetical protein